MNSSFSLLVQLVPSVRLCILPGPCGPLDVLVGGPSLSLPPLSLPLRVAPLLCLDGFGGPAFSRRGVDADPSSPLLPLPLQRSLCRGPLPLSLPGLSVARLVLRETRW